MFAGHTYRGLLISLVLFIALWATGCITPFNPCRIPRVEAPNEMVKTMLPPYVIEPPDILQISALQLVPKPPYLIRSLDIFRIQFPASPDTLKKDDIDDLVKTGRIVVGNFSVEPEGTFDLGPVYGKVNVVGLTIEKAREAIDAQLKLVTKKEIVEAGKVTLALIQSR